VGHHYQSASNSLASLPPRNEKFAVSRVAFLIGSALLLSFGQVILASGVVQNHAERFWIVSTLIGSGYGALFSLTPLIITVIWGVENFGTNWGIVAMVPALGATVWGIAYSKVYQWAAEKHNHEMAEDVLCYGKQCYVMTFWAMAISVWVGCGLILWAWKGPRGWSRRGIAV
jgi:MFS family permease